MPLPFALDHINLWALEDGDGWALVDAGLRSDTTARLWQQLLLQRERARRLTRIFVTHMHPDHVGMAGWLTRRFKVRLWMTRQEYLSCRVLMSDTCREAPGEAIDFYREAGWSAQAIERYRARFGDFGRDIHALPNSFRRLIDGEELRIAKHLWRVVVGSGHSPEHACLYCPDLKLFISGDQVLPRISSNVSVHPIEPDADPISDWLASLEKIAREVRDDVLVLPSHKRCFRGLHARLNELRQDLEASLTRLRHALKAPRRAVDVFPALFQRTIDERNAEQFSMASGESVACLNYLLRRGEVARERDSEGTAWYRLAG